MEGSSCRFETATPIMRPSSFDAAFKSSRKRVDPSRLRISAMAQDQPRDETAIDVGWWPLLQAAGNQWLRHNDARLGAALAFYSIFAVGPLITVICIFAGLVFGQEIVRSNVLATL